jgi:hypothetical protein
MPTDGSSEKVNKIKIPNKKIETKQNGTARFEKCELLCGVPKFPFTLRHLVVKIRIYI